MMNVECSLKFLQEQYGFSFNFQIFSKDVNDIFYGPMNAYSYHNANGCFTIYNAAQRNEWDYYTSEKYSQNQEILLSRNISHLVFNEIKEKRKSFKKFFRGEVYIVADIIKEQINKNGEFFGIIAIKNIKI